MEIASVILFFVAVLAMSTLGAVLLTRFFLSKLNRAGRIFTAAIGGPAMILWPMFLLIVAERGDDILIGFLGVGALVAGGSLIIGWPIAHFATKRLDQLTHFNLETFE